MKIALLTPTFSRFSGIDRVVEQQARNFTRNGNTVVIFTFEADLTPPENVEVQILGMPKSLLWQRFYRLVFPLDFAKALKWVSRLRGFDVVYSHGYPMNWLAYLARRTYRIKYIYYNHGIAPPQAFSNFMERTYIRLITPLANWTIRRADGIISVSQFLRRELKKETDLDSEVVYNSIDIQRFHKGIDGSKIRDRHKLRNDPVILYVGRISPHKGVHLLIKAFNSVKQEIPEAKLLIVGKYTFFSYFKKLRDMADDSVTFSGYISDEEVPYYYAACDVYTTATMWEGFNLPLAEAQACGKPVVAFNLGPHPEMVKDNETGLLVTPRDVRQLAEASIRILSHGPVAQQFGEAAYKYILKEFGVEKL